MPIPRPLSVYAYKSLPAPLAGHPGVTDLLQVPWDYWNSPQPVSSVLLDLQPPTCLGDVPEVLAAALVAYWAAHPVSIIGGSSNSTQLISEPAIPQEVTALFDSMLLLKNSWGAPKQFREVNLEEKQFHESLFEDQPCSIPYARRVLWDSMLDRLLSNADALKNAGVDRFDAFVSALDEILCMDRRNVRRIVPECWFSSVFVLEDVLDSSWKPFLDKIARHFATAADPHLNHDGHFIQWWKKIVQSPTGLDSWATLDPSVDHFSLRKQWGNPYLCWSHGSFLAVQAPINQLGPWIDALHEWDRQVDASFRVGRTLAYSALQSLIAGGDVIAKNTPDHILRLRLIAAKMAEWPKQKDERNTLASKVSSEDSLCSIVSRFRPSGANAEAYKELMTLLVRDVCWLDDTSPPIDACTKFPFGSVKTSMFAATIGRIIGMSVHSQDPHNDPFVAYVCDLMKLEMLDGHRADFVDKIFFATLKNEYMLPVQSILLSSILYAAPEDERTALLSDPRIAQACPTHSLVERDMLNKVSVSEDVLLTKTSKRRLF